MHLSANVIDARHRDASFPREAAVFTPSVPIRQQELAPYNTKKQLALYLHMFNIVCTGLEVSRTQDWGRLRANRDHDLTCSSSGTPAPVTSR